MVTIESNVNAFDVRFYQVLADRVAKYYQEESMVRFIPFKSVTPMEAEEYKKPLYAQSNGVYGETKPGIDGAAMETPKNTRIYDLRYVRSNMYFDRRDMMMEGGELAQMKTEQLNEWLRQCDLSIFKGVYTKGFDSSGFGQGTQLNTGVLDQATAVIDLDGADSTLAAQGDVYKALVKMVDSVPFRYRQGRTLHLGMTSHFWGQANSSTFTFDNGSTEWDSFYNKYVLNAVKGFKVSPDIMVTDEFLIDSTDTLNTHDRLFIMVGEADIIERAYSLNPSQLGMKDNEIGGVTQAWAAKESGCVHQPDAVLYSEQIAWA